MTTRKWRGFTALFAAATLSLASQLTWAQNRPVLSSAAWSGGQVQFVLHGETNLSYVIQSSTNLRTWTAVITNTEPQDTRLVAAPTVADGAFWRVVGPVFQHAIAARWRVTLTNGNQIIDSFDSADPNFSTNGQYDPAKRRSGGDVASTTNTIDVGDAKIAGILHTGPGGTATIGPNGSVGSLAWLSNPANAGQIEPGHIREDMNLSFSLPSLPFTSGPSPGPGGGYTYLLSGGNYRISGTLMMDGSRNMLVTGNSKLYVTESIYVKDNASIQIQPGARLEMYVASQVYVQGNGRINHLGTPDRFLLVGLREGESFYIQGNAYVVGSIYAPRTKLYIQDIAQLFGACTANEVVVQGNAQVHFDESFLRAGPFF